MKKLILLFVIICNFIAKAESLPQSPFITEDSENLRLLIITTDALTKGDNKIFNEYVIWKRQLGFDVTVESKTAQWNLSDVQSCINNWRGRYGGFVLILGGESIVKSHTLTCDTLNKRNTYASDLYLFTTNAGRPSDFSDISEILPGGRITANSPEETATVLWKIMEYEQNPPSEDAFYQSPIHCSRFEDKNLDNYEDLRAVLTSENILSAVKDFGISAKRYYTSNIAAQNRYYSNAYTSTPTRIDNTISFSTIDNVYESDILTSINKGTLYVLYAGHGSTTYWESPTFNSWNQMRNGTNFPVFISLGCLTGAFKDSFGCLAGNLVNFTSADTHSGEDPVGGAIAAIGSSDVSYNPYIFAYGLGFFHAMFPNSNLIPKKGLGNGNNISNHAPLNRLGHIYNYGKNFLLKLYNGSTDNDIIRHIKYECEIIHLFGDPSMQFYYQKPLSLPIPQIEYSNGTYTIRRTDKVGNAILTIGNTSDSSSFLKTTGSTITYQLKATEDYHDISVCLSAPGYRPIIIKAPSPTESFASIQNASISNAESIIAKSVKIGTSIDNTKTYGPVTIKSPVKISTDTLTITPTTTLSGNGEILMDFLN